LAKFLSGHPNICTMFLMMHARTPAKAAAAQVLEAIIALQETEDATQVKLLQALQLEFSMVARIKYGLKEKGVSWFSQESEFGPRSPGNSIAITPPNLTPAVLVMGAKYKPSSNPDKLGTQPNKQTFQTTRQPDLCSLAFAVLSVGRLVQQLDPQPSSDQGSRTCCSGQGYPPLHLVSTVTEPAYHTASGPFFMRMGQENGFPPASVLSSQHYVCA
jgi:hypothetical protein